MTFIVRAVLILLAFGFIVYVLKAILRLSSRLKSTVKEVKTMRDQLGGKMTASADMVRCASCGAFVSARDAVTISSRNHAQMFCSRECLTAHAKSA